MTVFTVCVKHVLQIEPVLNLLEKALERVPGQEIPIYQQESGKPQRMKRHIAVDAEFKAVWHPTDQAQVAAYLAGSAAEENLPSNEHSTVSSGDEGWTQWSAEDDQAAATVPKAEHPVHDLDDDQVYTEAQAGGSRRTSCKLWHQYPTRRTKRGTRA